MPKGQVQAWALNSLYYQATDTDQGGCEPDRACEDAAIRENGARACTIMTAITVDGGNRAMAQASPTVWVDREYVTSLRGLLPGTKFA